MDWPLGPHKKRHKNRHIWDNPPLQDEIFAEGTIPQEDTVWESGFLLALDLPQELDAAIGRDGARNPSSGQNKKRNHSSLTFDDPLDQGPGLDATSTFQAQGSLNDLLFETFPSVLSKDDRHVNLAILNPFAEDSENRHPCLRQTIIPLPKDGEVNSYVKVRFWMPDNGAATAVAPKYSAFARKAIAGHHHHTFPNVPGGKPNIPSLPPNFGRGLKLDELDSKLFKFYLVAFVDGRTLLPQTNMWQRDFAPMAAGSDCLKHALLSFASGYCLDYASSEILRARANYHYKTAVELLNKELADPETHEPGKGDSVVASVIMLFSDDIVNWELRRPKNREQRWWGGCQVAKAILINTNPGYLYWKFRNVQSNTARISNVNWVAYVDISTQIVTPWKIEDTDTAFSWLLAGSERDLRKIHGGTGVCPKLLHIFAQVTHLTRLMAETPDSIIIPQGAEELAESLVDFRQWSELSEGYETQQEMLDSCKLDPDGKVKSCVKVTELTAETWVAAAQIYLQCRFFRRPRSAESVLASLDVLLRCIERMPTSGPLFTSQSPFPTIVLAGLVSYREQDRQVIRDWFHILMAGAGCRSSVPPVWEALQGMWDWMDTTLVEDLDADNVAIGQKRAWWEEMVAKLTEDYGFLNLA